MVAYNAPQDVIDVVLSLKHRFAARDQLFDKIDQMVFGKTPILIPEAYRYYALSAHSPLAMFASNMITSTLCSNPIKVQFAPVRMGEAGDENATLRENWHEASWERQEEDAARSVYYPWMFSLVTKGLAVQKTLLRSQSLWANYYTFSKGLYRRLKDNPELSDKERNQIWAKSTEEKKLTVPFPIMTTDVPANTFYYLRGEQGLTVAAEHKFVPYSRLLADFNGMKKIDPRALGLPVSRQDLPHYGSDEMLPVYELWTSTHVHWVVEGLGEQDTNQYLIGKMAHNFGDEETGTLKGPYSIAQGVPTSSREPELEAVGALYAFLEVLPLLDAVLTARGQVAFYTGWPPLERIPRAGPLGGLNPEEVFAGTPTIAEEDENPIFEPGNIMPIGVRFAQPPRTGEDLQALQGTLMEFIAPLLPASAYGAGPAESGYAQNQRLHMNMLVWNPFVKNAQNALAHRFTIEDMLIEELGEPVYVERWAKSKLVEGGAKRERVRWLPLGPEDIQGASKYHVLIEPSTPSNDALLVKQLMDEKAAGWCSDYEALERLGKNPDEVMLQRDVERIMASPPVQQQMDEQILQGLGFGQEQKLREAQQRMAQLAAAGYNSPNGQPQPPAPPSGGGGGPGVYAPGVGMPRFPTPAGAVQGPAPQAPGPVPGNPAGPQLPPPGAFPLPGQGA